jgi:hypothetical protein
MADGHLSGITGLAPEGLTGLSAENYNQYLTREGPQSVVANLKLQAQKPGNSNYNTQNIYNLNLLKSLQNKLMMTQGGKNVQLVDPNKNLRNFFIQSSLTFNGNNLNTRQSKPKSMGSEEQ